jgi:hypothetical protein
MSKRLAIATTAIAALLAVPAAFAMPVDGITGPTYSATATCPSGKIIVYVTQNVRNSADQGQLGNVWAIDNYQRLLMIDQVTPTTFCAATSYRYGSFTAVGGPSPGGTGTVSQGLQGTMGAGYRTTTFFGLLRPFPLAPTYGSFTTDYGCDSSGNCPGYVDWTTLYFSSVVGFTPNYWAYAYATTSNGNWLEAPGRLSGDITG